MPLKLARRHGSPFWYIRGSIRGVRVDESTGLGERKAAEEALIVRSAEIVRQSIHGHAAVRTFADAALSHMEAGGERKYMTPLIKHFGNTKLSQIGQTEVDHAVKKLKPDAGAATINRQIISQISAVLHHAARKQWCDKPLLTRLKEPEGRVRWLTFEEADRLIAAAAPHLQPLVIFLLSTGARLSEALYLDWRHVDLSAGHVSIMNVEGGGVGVKNGDSRGVPLHPRAVAALANLPHRTGAVFRTQMPATLKNGRILRLGPPYESRNGEGGGQVKTAWRGMVRRAGITDFTPHDCRHTWATWHYRANRDLTALMELGGWKSVDMVMRYAHVNTSHLAGSINRLWGAPAAIEGVQQTATERSA